MCVLSVSPNSLWFKFPTSCVLWQKVREQWVIAYLHLVSCISGGPCCVIKFLTLQTQEQSYQLATSLLNKTLKFLLPCVTVEQRWGTASLKKKKKDFPDPIVVLYPFSLLLIGGSLEVKGWETIHMVLLMKSVKNKEWEEEESVVYVVVLLCSRSSSSCRRNGRHSWLRVIHNSYK